MKVLAKLIANHLPGGTWIARHMGAGGRAAAEEVALRARVFKDYVKVSEHAQKRLAGHLPANSASIAARLEQAARREVGGNKAFMTNQALHARRISDAPDADAVFVVLKSMHPNFLETAVPDAAIARLAELHYLSPAARQADLAKVRQLVSDRERWRVTEQLAFWLDATAAPRR